MSGGLGDIKDNAKAAAKEIAYLIGGFDELNVLPSSKNAGKDVDNTMGDVLGGITLPEYDMFEGLAESKVAEWVEKLRTPLKIVLGMVAAVGAGLLAWKVGQGVLTGLTVVRGLLRWITGKDGGLLMIQAIAPKVASALSTIGPTVFMAAGAIGIMVARFVDLYANSEKFRTGLLNIWEIIRSMGEGLWDGLVAGLEPAKQALADLGNTILDLLPQEWRDTIVNFFTSTLPDLLSKLDLDFMDLAITILGIGLLFIPGGQVVGVALLGFEAISIGIRGMGLLTDEQLESIKQGFKTVFENIGRFVSGVISGIVVFITNQFGGIIGFIKGVFTGNWQQAFESIKEIAMAPIRGIAAFVDRVFGIDIIDSAKAAVNHLIGYFNRFIGWLNEKLHIDFSGFSLGNHQIIPSFDIQLARVPNIPYLADGGVLTGPQLVMAGEYPGASTNPEIVTPQNLMRDTVVEANAEMIVAIVTAIQSLQRAVEDKDQNVYISEGDIGRAAAAYAQQQRRRTGHNPLTSIW